MKITINGTAYPDTDDYSVKPSDDVEQFTTESGGTQEIVRALDVLSVSVKYIFTGAWITRIHAHKRLRPLTVVIGYPDPEAGVSREMYITDYSELYIAHSENQLAGGLWEVSFTLVAYAPD